MAQAIFVDQIIRRTDGQPLIVAMGFLGRKTFDWDDALDVAGNYNAAVRRYVAEAKNVWAIVMEADSPGGSGLVFIAIPGVPNASN